MYRLFDISQRPHHIYNTLTSLTLSDKWTINSIRKKYALNPNRGQFKGSISLSEETHTKQVQGTQSEHNMQPYNKINFPKIYYNETLNLINHKTEACKLQ